LTSYQALATKIDAMTNIMDCTSSATFESYLVKATIFSLKWLHWAHRNQAPPLNWADTSRLEVMPRWFHSKQGLGISASNKDAWDLFSKRNGPDNTRAEHELSDASQHKAPENPPPQTPTYIKFNSQKDEYKLPQSVSLTDESSNR
jgi:hypothetical protein